MAQGTNDFGPEIEKEPDELRHEIEHTRSALTDKLETLEDRVKGTVETAQHKVEDTLAAVKRTFDIRYQTEQRPWLVFGSSIVAGFIVGSIRAKKPALAGAVVTNGHGGNGNGVHSLSNLASGGHVGSARKKRHGASHRPTLKTRLVHQFEDEIALLEKAAIGGVMGTIRDWLKQAMPSMATQLEKVMDSATSKLGGEPVPSTEGSKPFSQYGGR